MLSSELRGVIEDNTDWHLRTRQRAGRRGTRGTAASRQGWRRYDVPKLLRNEYKEPYYPLEAGQEIAQDASSARPCSPKRRSSTATRCGCWYPGAATPPRLPSPRTGAYRHLDGFDFPDSTTFVLRRPVRGRTITDARILITPDSFPEYRTLPRLRQPDPTYVAQARRYIEQRGTADMRNIVIDTVVVTAKPWDDDIDENAPESPPGRTVVERRADQGGQRRDDPRLHREDARNAGHGTKGTIPWAQTGLYG